MPLLFSPSIPANAEGGHGDGTDIEFGGIGEGDRLFHVFRDLTTDPEGKTLCKAINST